MQKILDPNNIYISDLPLLVAVSGGVDSMVLLDIVMQKVQKKHIFVVHFDHGLRGEESDGDREFVSNFCKIQDLGYFQEIMDIAALAQNEKTSIEATARKYRYRFFARIMNEHPHICMLLTAHHLDDRIETALFNLIRGTRFTGIYALRENDRRMIFPYKSPISLFRPLIAIPKSEIIAYAEHHSIVFREDVTNTDVRFQRNFLRHEVLPKFETINPQYREAINGFIEYIETFAGVQNTKAFEWLSDQSQQYAHVRDRYHGAVMIFSKKSFFALDTIFQYAIIGRLYKISHGGNMGLSQGLMDEIMRFISGDAPFGIKKIRSLHMERRGDWIVIKDESL